jgi:hypothetical protein
MREVLVVLDSQLMYPIALKALENKSAISAASERAKSRERGLASALCWKEHQPYAMSMRLLPNRAMTSVCIRIGFCCSFLQKSIAFPGVLSALRWKAVLADRTSIQGPLSEYAKTPIPSGNGGCLQLT